MKLKIALVVASIAALLIPASSAAAQSTSSQSTGAVSGNSNSMRISPVRTDVAIDPGASKDVTVYAQNLNTQPVQVKAIISDFSPSNDESGRPNILLETDEYAPTHSLKRLAKITPDTFTIPANTRTSVKVTITVPQSAKAGGYYGAVRFIPVADLSTGESAGVAVSTNVGSLVLLRVNGELEEKMNVASFDVRQKNEPGTFFNTAKDLKVRLRLANEGNIQVAPYGKITVKDRSGKVVEEHQINNTDPRGNVLPDSIRRFETDLKKVGSFGKYTVEGNFGYGTNGELLTTKASFWVVPTAMLIGGGVILLAIILLIIFIPKMIRSYNKRILSRAGRRY